MIRILRSLVLTAHLIVSCLLGILYGVVRPFHPTNSRWCSRTFAFLGLPILGIKSKVTGQENFPTDRPFVIVANHQSNWDLFIVGDILPPRTVSIGKKSLKWIPLFGQLYWLAGNILIDRGDKQKAMHAMETTKNALLKKRTNIWFFAEGTRNLGDNMLPFKKGAFITAIEAGVPIIPLCCSSYRKNLDLNQLNNGYVDIKVLPAIETDGLSKDDVENLMQSCHSEMTTTIAKLDEALGIEKTMASTNHPIVGLSRSS